MQRHILARAVLWTAILGGIIVATAIPTYAVNTWDGGGADNNWSTLLNWDNDLVPVWPQAITFAGTTRLTPNNDLSSITVNGIAFNAGAGAFVIGGNGVALNGGITDNATNGQRINLDLALAATENIFAGQGGTLTIGGALTGSGIGINKLGSGTLTLVNANTGGTGYTGPTIVKTGTLSLNFSDASAPATDILNSATAVTLGGGVLGLPASGATNTIANGILSITGKASTVNSQTIGGLLIDTGYDRVTVSSGATGGSSTLNLGAITHNVGGTVNFTLPGTGSITTSTANDASGILGGWATVGNNTTNAGGSVFGTDWATKDGSGNIVAYTGYLDHVTSTNVTALAGYTSASNLRVTSASTGNVAVGSGTVELNSILVNDTANRVVDVGSGNTLRLGTNGSIFRTDTATANTLTIGTATGAAGGTLTAGGPTSGTPGQIYIRSGGSSQSGGGLIVNSVIADNGAGGTVSLVLNGPAIVNLAGANTFTGDTYINSGRITGSTTAFGVGANATLHIQPGGQAFLGGGTWNYNFDINGTGTNGEPTGAIRLGGTIPSSKLITLAGDSRIAGTGANVQAQITGNYALDLGTSGNVGGSGSVVTLGNHTNNWTGNTTMVSRTGGTANNTVVTLGADEVIPDGPGFGNVTIGFTGITASTTTFNLNGHSETINGLSSAGTATLDLIQNNSANSTGTLTIGNNNQTSTFAGIIQNGTGTVAIAKTGAGALTLSGANTYSGGTIINQGSVKFGGATALGTGNITVNASGTLDLNGNSPTAGLLAGSGTVTNSNAAAGALTVGNANNLSGTFGGVIQNGAGTVALTKAGTGTLTLSGASTYTGATTIGAGALVVTGSQTGSAVAVNSGGTLAGAGNLTTTGKVGDVTLSSGGIIRPGITTGDNSIGSLTMSSLTVNGGDFRVDVSSTNDLINVVGTATFSAASTFTPTFPTGITNGNYTLLQATTLNASTNPTLNFSSSSRLTIGLVTTTGANGTVKLSVSGNTKNLTWTGAVDHLNWDLNSTHNWKDQSNVSETYFDLDNVTFDDTTVDHNVTLGFAAQPGSVTVNTAGTYTFSGGGSIGGFGGLTVTGGGTLNLSLNGNSYLGATTVSNGTLKINSSTTLPTNTALTLGNGSSNTAGTLDVNGNSVSLGSLTSAGSGTSIIGNSGSGNAVVTVNGSTGTFAGTIQDVIGTNSGQKVALTVTGGTPTLSGANTYTGDTNINGGGTLKLGSSSSLPSGANLILGESSGNTSGTLDLGGFNATLSNLQTQGTSTASAIGNSSTTSDSILTVIPGTGNTVTYTGKIFDTLGAGTHTTGLTLNNGTLVLNAANTFSGPTHVLSGATLKVAPLSTNAFSTPLGSTASAASNTVTIDSGATLDLTTTLNATTLNSLNFGLKQFSIAGTGVGGIGAIVNSQGSGQQNAFQKITLTGDATIFADGDPNATNQPGRIDMRAAQVAGANVAKLDLAGFTLTKNGTSFFGLVGTDVTPGNIIANAGVLQIESTSNVLGGPGSGTLTYNNDGTYASFFANTGTITRPMVMNGAINIGNSSNTAAAVGSPIQLNGNPTVVPRNANGTGDLTLSGNITETGGSRTITKSNNGTGNSRVILSGNNSFTGGLVINGGIVELGSAGALNSTTPNNVTFNSDGATLRLAGNSVTIAGVPSATIGSIIENAGVAGGTLTLSNAGTTTFAGVIRDGSGTGTMDLTVAGGGTLILNNNDTYSGATNINGGTLQIGDGGANGSIANTSGVGGTSGTLAFNRNTALSFAVPITGSIGVDKNNGNTLTLTGTNNYSGTTNLNSGTLVVTGALNSSAAVSLASSATLGGAGDGITTGKIGNLTMASNSNVHPGATALDGSIGTLTVNGLTVNGGDFRSDIVNAGNMDLVKVTNTANFTNGSSTTFTPVFSVQPTSGQYTLLSAGNLTIDPGANLQLNSPGSGNTRLSFTLVSATGSNGTIKLSVTGNAANLVWTGTQTSDWDIVSHTNWKIGSTPNQQYFDLDNVTFDDSSSVSTHNVTLNATVTPGTVTVNANTNYTISGGGKITGITGLTKSGNGTLILATNNDYSGTTVVNAGTLQVGDPSINGGTSGTLGSGQVTTNGILAFGRTDTVTVLGAIDGTGQIKQAGTGTLVLAANNTYGGGTLINASGTLQVGDPNTNAGTTGSLGNGNVTNNGNLSFNHAGSFAINNAISGTGSLQQNFAGSTLTLGGASSYSGTTTINAGTLSISASNNIGDGSATNTIAINNNSVLQATGTADLGANRSIAIGSGGATIDVTGTNVLTVGGGLSGTQNLTKTSGGTLALGGNSSGFSGAVAVNAGTLSISASNNLGDGSSNNAITMGNSSTLQSTGTTDLGVNRNITLTTAGTIDVTGTNALTVSGNITGGSATLNKTSSGKLILTGTNSYTGTTTITAGTIEAGPAAAFAGLNGQVHFVSGTFHVTGNPGDVVYALQGGTSTGTPTSNKFTTSGTAASTGTFDIDSGVTLQVGALDANGNPFSTVAALQTAGSGTAGSSFFKTGAGTLRIVSRNNQLDSSLIIQQGTVDAWGARSLGGIDAAANNTELRNSATLVLSNDGVVNSDTSNPTNTNNIAAITGADFLSQLRSGTAGGSITVISNRMTSGAGLTHGLGAIQSVGDFTLHVQPGPNVTSGNSGLYIYPSGPAAPVQATAAAVLSGNATFDVANSANATMTLTINGGITGTGFGINKTGNGTLLLSNNANGTLPNVASSYSGATTVTQGTLLLAAPNMVPAASGLLMAGGTFNAAGNSDIMNTLTEKANSTIDLGSGGSNALTFNDSSLLTESWSGTSTLTISNWDSVNHLNHIFVGTGNTTLTRNQLNDIVFSGSASPHAVLTNSGELIPGTPLPSLKRGDLNNNGTIEGGDLTKLLQALVDIPTYESTFPGGALTDAELLDIADVNKDGVVNNADIQSEINSLITGVAPPADGGPLPGGGAAPVPEPAGMALIAIGGVVLLAYRRHRAV